MYYLGTLLCVFSLLLSCGEKSFKSGSAAQSPQPQNLNQQPSSGLAFQPVSYDAQQSLSYPVDIMFLVDGSDSMSQYAQRILNNLPVLIQSFQNQNSGFDYQIFVVSRYSSFSGFNQQKYKHVNAGIGSHNALEVGQKYVNELSSGSSTIGLRSGAVKEFVVVTDDNSNMNPETFKAWATQQAQSTGPVQVNGIVRLGRHCGGILTVFSDAKPGTTYQAISQFPETQGKIEELCSDNWNLVFQNLSKQLTTRKSISQKQFPLPQGVSSAEQVMVSADSRILQPNTEWRLDAASSAIEVLVDLGAAQTVTISPAAQ